MRLDVATGGELPRRAGRPACPADRLVLHGNNKIDRRAAPRAGRRRRPHRRRLASTSSTASRRCTASDGLVPPRCSCASRPASRRTPTSSCGPARTTRSSASAWRRATPTAAVERAAASRRRSSSSACTCTSAARCSSPTSSSRRSRSWRRSSASSTCAELSIGGGLGVAYVEGEEAPTITAVGASRSATRATAAGITARGHRRAGPGDRRRRRRSRCTRSAPSRSCPASAPTSSVDGGMSDNPRPGALRQRLRDVPATRAVRRPAAARSRVVGKHCESGDVLVRDAPGARRPRRGRHPGHAGHRRLRPLDGLELQQGARARRWCSCRDGEAAWWCGGRRSTTCCDRPRLHAQSPGRIRRIAGVATTVAGRE